MIKITDKNIGWFQAVFNIVVLWGIANLAIGYCAKILGVNVILFACIAFASSALCLLLVSGYGRLAKETLKSLDTWAYGVILLLTYICVFLLFAETSATEGSLLLMFSMSISLLASWFFFSRKPSKGQILGNGVVLVGLFLTCYDIPSGNKMFVFMLTFALAITATIRIFLAEVHKPYVQATHTQDPKARARVIAFVMFIVSLIFTIFTLIIAFLKTLEGAEALTIFSGFPVLADFLNPATVFAGLIYGAILMAPLRYLEFSSTSHIRAENYLTVTALAPASTLFWEWITQPITGLSLETISTYDFAACALITLGAFWAASSQIKHTKRKEKWQDFVVYQPQNLSAIDDSREMVANTLEHYNGDVRKSARALAIPAAVIQALLEDADKVLSFTEKTLRQVAREYRKNVAMSDALTGLANRSAFMTALKTAPYEEEQFSILYIDLDKFKPVNDTYGHEAGDKVLQMVADRLKKHAPKHSVVTRMGGDEYCILLLGSTPQITAKTVKTVKDEIAHPYHIEGIKEAIHISASIGLANYPEDGDNPEELLAIADKGMFGVKHSRD